MLFQPFIERCCRLPVAHGRCQFHNYAAIRADLYPCDFMPGLFDGADRGADIALSKGKPLARHRFVNSGQEIDTA